MDEQTIWLAPRATRFAEVCDACADDHPEIFVAVTVVGELDGGEGVEVRMAPEYAPLATLRHRSFLARYRDTFSR